MIIGFLGKGGSGKTTLATLYTKYLLDNNNFNFAVNSKIDFKHENMVNNYVLALDNDHNMDFKFNLGHTEDMNWMGQSLKEIFEKISISSTKDVADIDAEHIFSLSPLDDITEKYSVEIKDKDSGKSFRLMSAGPHTPDMMYGNICSHGLTTPLKVYLPFLKLNDNEFVIVDEKAGTDGVGTGVTTGFNLAVVVAEATTHGVKAAKQIIDMLKFYKTPYVIVINKIKSSENNKEEKEEFNFDSEFTDLNKENSKNLILHFNFNNEAFELKSNDAYKVEFKKLYEFTKEISDDRKERTKERIKKQKDFNDAK